MRSGWKNIALAAITTLISYALAELLFSYLFVHGIIKPPSRDGWYFETLGNTVHFDPVIGYRLGTTASRQLRISNDQIEHRGVFVGNNQGFPDRDDFSPERSDTTTRRIAIIGDSFSSGQFLDKNWPDAVEDIGRQQPQQPPLQLLNFSVYSGGLANWYNIVTKILATEDYQLDALVFPVFANDLFRPFMLFEARDSDKLLIGRAGWDPTQWPQTHEQAMSYLSPSDGYILTPAQWKQFENGQWHPELPRSWAPYMTIHIVIIGQSLYDNARSWLANPREQWAAWKASRRLTDITATAAPAPDESLSRGHFSAQHLRLIQALRDYAQQRQIPVLVVRIPDVHEATSNWPPAGNVLEFVELMHADFVDGADAFAGLTASERRAQYFPVDGHWNQQGSDHFARYIYPRLLALAAQRPAVPASPRH